MIVDSSAIVAVLLDEPERKGLVSRIAGTRDVRMSAATYLEVAIVVDRVHDPVLSRQLDSLLHTLGVEVVPVDVGQARTARGAYRDFGKGSHHPARLSYGDCFSYALARELDEPLLYVGNDFAHTDVKKA